MRISVAEEIRQLRELFWSDRDPEGRVFAPLADAYRRQGDLGQALELLEEGLGRQTDFAPGHVVSGWVRRDRGENEEAALAFRSALALDAENAEAQRGLAELIELAPNGRDSVTEPPVEAPVPAPAALEAPAPTAEDGPVTRTMADLYARQGLHERALRVYRRLLERDPADHSLRTRIAELEALAPRTGRRGAAAADVEKLARDWAEGPGATGELSTPFAWTPAASSPPERGGPVARAYFEGLLTWEPGSPMQAPEVPVEPEEAFAAALDAAPEPVVGIASLAPDAVPIASLAPDAVPISSLAPDAVPIASLAPDASGWIRLR